jgi:hypothetical protein
MGAGDLPLHEREGSGGQTMLSKHVFHLGETAPQVSTPHGARTSVRGEDFPILERMSLTG